MYVCFCAAVTDRAVLEAIESGARTVEDVTSRSRAGSGCGGCRRSLDALISSRERRQEVAEVQPEYAKR
jgi:bacterioferritin-associated ferredoxin